MRRSGITTLNLNLNIVDQEAIREIDQKHEAFAATIQPLVLALQHQLELLDDLEITGSKTDNGSFLYKIVTEIIAFDSRWLQGQSQFFAEAIAAAVKKGEIDCRDDILFSKRGARKTNIEEKSIRRMSFAATNYSDNTELLRVERLREMTDLEFLFSLNGYHLPYANSTPRRTMYQEFFGVFLNVVTTRAASQNSPDNEQPITEEVYLFGLLQETIYMLHTITEYTVSIVECIFEMIGWINPRLKSLPMSINLKLPTYTGASSPLLDHLLNCFSDGNKIFSQFAHRRLISAINELKCDEILDWKGRFDNYDHSLQDGFELYGHGCDQFIKSVERWRQQRRLMLSKAENEEAGNPDIDTYLTDATLYIDQTKQFILLLAGDQSVYRKFYRAGAEFLNALGLLEERYPMRYSGTPRGTGSPRIFGITRSPTPRSPKSPLSKSQGGSNNGSPRTGSDLESPVRTPESRGMLSRLTASVFGTTTK